MIDLDLKAMFYCTLAALPAMRARGDGRIVHIASQAGVSLTPITGPSYMAAKHAVVTFTSAQGLRSVDLLKIASISLAAVAKRAKPLQRATLAFRAGSASSA